MKTRFVLAKFPSFELAQEFVVTLINDLEGKFESKDLQIRRKADGFEVVHRE